MGTQTLPPKRPPSRATPDAVTPTAISKRAAFACNNCGHFFATRKIKAPKRKCSVCQSTDLRPVQLVAA